ncbi:translation initiation factor, aIF-2BI family protein [Neobacillus vireti LMG 21834]|uniref:Methylthioribose-1-phosphate isomerase n=1 Tax=Neobacillus vireti LMG 21834 TaxID=1131730 RepID=A0AB94IT77_9BACI|nr:S-methyl-5-thioribose-1-phosphate isomerase [Neobacillus vireti]ETI70279.1 translation initiation factor, aIF-2BI family protein [Neobacillus vireti LMG 21834]
MENTFLQSVSYENGVLKILDQTKIPNVTEFLEITKIEDAWDAIKQLKVRGAPAIGIAAAYGLVVGMKNAPETSFADFYAFFKKQADYLGSSRPTAVNLFWALKRMDERAQKKQEQPIAKIKQALEDEAHLIRNEDEEVCRTIGEHALTLLEDGMGILTHCNAGGIATARYGTALAPLYLAKEKGWDIKVFADETRPLLQGARLTAWELMQAGIDVTLITDNMAAMVMQKGWVQAVIVGCDRVAANGDVANKIGTYGVALLAKAHQIPFYVAAPMSTIDLETKTGADIPIEEREAAEITEGFGKRTAPEGVKVFNPAFDVTPHELVTAIITEKGILTGNYQEELPRLFQV